MRQKDSYIYRHKRRTVLGLSILLLLLIYFFQESSFILRATATIAFLAFFYFIDHFFIIRFRPLHYAFIIIIALLGLMLSPLYFIYPNYDKIQHFIIPILTSSVIFFMINKLNLHIKWKLTFTLFVTAGLLGLFEIGEYMLDWLFDFKLQGVFLRDVSGLDKFNLIQEPLDDTIADLILGFFGAFAYAIYKGIRNKEEFYKSY